MLSKAQLIDGILSLNPSATSDWLARFEVPALTRYLNHLDFAREPRGRGSFWFRDAETSASMTRAPAT